jgi:hypothetical protein
VFCRSPTLTNVELSVSRSDSRLVWPRSRPLSPQSAPATRRSLARSMPMACTVTHLSTWPTCEEQPQYLPKAQQPSPTPLQQDEHAQEGLIAGSSTSNCFKPPPIDLPTVPWKGTTAFLTALMFTYSTPTSLHIDLSHLVTVPSCRRYYPPVRPFL